LTDWNAADPFNMYTTHNPTKIEKDANDEIEIFRKDDMVDLLEESDEKVVKKLLEEYYTAKSGRYRVCGCKYCKMLTLPFMVKKGTTSLERLQRIEQKHRDYYFSCIKKEIIGSCENNLSYTNNIFFKSIYLNQAIAHSTYKVTEK